MICPQKLRIRDVLTAELRLLEALCLGWLSMGGVLWDLRVQAGSAPRGSPQSCRIHPEYMTRF